MLQRMFALKGRSWAGFGSLMGAVALLCAPAAWSQESTTEARGAQAETKGAAQAGNRPARSQDGGTSDETTSGRGARPGGFAFRHPYHTYSLNKEREEVEILEAQLAAKRAHLRLAEARLKQAQDQLAFLKQKGDNDPSTQERIAMLQAELPVLEAERDAEQAEIREPQVLLKHARRWLQFFEDLGRQMDSGLGMGMMGPMGMGHMGMEHMGGMPFMGMGSGMGHMGDVDDELSQLRAAVENLGRQIESLKNEPGR